MISRRLFSPKQNQTLSESISKVKIILNEQPSGSIDYHDTKKITASQEIVSFSNIHKNSPVER